MSVGLTGSQTLYELCVVSNFRSVACSINVLARAKRPSKAAPSRAPRVPCAREQKKHAPVHMRPAAEALPPSRRGVTSTLLVAALASSAAHVRRRPRSPSLANRHCSLCPSFFHAPLTAADPRADVAVTPASSLPDSKISPGDGTADERSQTRTRRRLLNLIRGTRAIPGWSACVLRDGE